METLWASSTKSSVGGLWVFTLKKNKNGEIVKHKSHYVAKGSNQIFGSDYLATFAPTAKFSSTRMILAFATRFHCDVFQFDFRSAYLNAGLEENVCVEQPTDFEIPGKGPKFVCKLLKGLYGLKQAGRCWSRTLDKFFYWTRSNTFKDW